MSASGGAPVSGLGAMRTVRAKGRSVSSPPRAAKFLFEIKGNAHPPARPTEVFSAKKIFAQENQLDTFDGNN
jgi:hypothetical protein